MIAEVVEGEVDRINLEAVEHLLDHLVVERKSCAESFLWLLALVRVVCEGLELVAHLEEVEEEVGKVAEADHRQS